MDLVDLFLLAGLEGLLVLFRQMDLEDLLSLFRPLVRVGLFRLQVQEVRHNDYRFISERALEACSTYEVESISLLAVKQG